MAKKPLTKQKQMKKFSLWALLLMFSIIGLQSCKEDLVADEGQSQDDLSGMTARGAAPSAISKLSYTDRFGNKQEILNFATKEDYRNALDRLEQKYDANSDLEDEYRVLLNFDKEYHFTSLLQDYINAETTWLMTEDLPEATDPDTLFDDIDEPELALLNKDRAVMVGGKILVYINGGMGIIKDGSFAHLNEVLNFDWSLQTQRFIGGTWWTFILVYIWAALEDHVQDDPDDACKVRNRFRETHRIGDRKYKIRAKYKTQNEWTTSRAKIKLKMKAYKKRRWFGWKKVKANMKIALDGQYGTGKCVLEHTYNNESYSEYTKKIKHSWYTGNHQEQFYIQDDVLYGDFYVDNNRIKHLDLFNGF